MRRGQTVDICVHIGAWSNFPALSVHMEENMNTPYRLKQNHEFRRLYSKGKERGVPLFSWSTAEKPAAEPAALHHHRRKLGNAVEAQPVPAAAFGSCTAPARRKLLPGYDIRDSWPGPGNLRPVSGELVPLLDQQMKKAGLIPGS